MSEKLIDAHTALADAKATLEVLKAQTLKYNELENNISFLSDFSKINQSSVDYAGRIALDQNKEPIINFGKHKGKKVMDVFKKEPGYYAWIMRGDFFSKHETLFHKNLGKLKK